MQRIQANESAPLRESKSSPIGWIAVVVLIVLIVGLLVWQGSALTGIFKNNGSDSGYSQLNLVHGIAVKYESGNDSFVFSYRLNPSDETGLFYLSKNVEQSRSYPAVPGAVYRDLGLEIKISSVTMDLLVLQVKPF